MKTEKKDQRRSFLKHLLAGTVIAAGTSSIVKSTKAGEGRGQINITETLYRETEEFKSYYRSLRL